MRAQLSTHMAEAMHMPVLAPVESDQEMPPVALDRATCVVGREGVHLPLHSNRVSRAHALIVNDQDCVYIRDLASKNHTFVNDNPVREMPLDEADVIRIGDVVFRCASGFRKRAPQAIFQSDRAALQVDGVGGQTPLTQRTALIGTRLDCEVRLRGPQVAHAHAVVFERNGKRFIRDLHSATGTFVNGERVREVQLNPGDEIIVGGVPIRYLVGATATGEEAAKATAEASPAARPAPRPQPVMAPALELDDSVAPLPMSIDDDELASEMLSAVDSAHGAKVVSDGAAPSPANAAAPDTLELKDDELKTDQSNRAAPQGAAPQAPAEPAVPSSPDYDEVIPVASEDEKPAAVETNTPETRATVSPPAPKKILPAESGDDSFLIPLASDENAGAKSPAAAASQATQVPAQGESPATTSPQEEEASNEEEPVRPEKITQLVGELAEKAQELETVWRDYQESESAEGHRHRGDDAKSGDAKNAEARSSGSHPGHGNPGQSARPVREQAD